MSIKLTLASNSLDAARILRILTLMLRMPMGKALMEKTGCLRQSGVDELKISLDRQMTDAYGLYQRKGRLGSISLSPHLNDAALAGVLLHELRHAYQPWAGVDAYGKDMTTLALTQTRLNEGDAFTHQFCATLDSPDPAVIREGFCLIAGNFHPDIQELYREQATAWRMASDTAQKYTVMRTVFWLLQATRLARYDTNTIAYMKVLQKGNALRPMPCSVFESTLDMVIDLQLLPAALPGARDGAYLGADDHGTAAAFVKAARKTQDDHTKISVMNSDATLKYSNAFRNDSLKSKR